MSNGNPEPRPEHLLGGYATRNLSPEEERQLLEAALQDQQLFDALADELAMRETIDQPGAREQLAADLQPRRSRWRQVVAWFAQPKVWAPAGALAAVAVVLLVVRDRPPELYSLQVSHAPAEQPTPAVSSPPAVIPEGDSRKPASPARVVLTPGPESGEAAGRAAQEEKHRQPEAGLRRDAETPMAAVPVAAGTPAPAAATAAVPAVVPLASPQAESRKTIAAETASRVIVSDTAPVIVSQPVPVAYSVEVRDAAGGFAALARPPREAETIRVRVAAPYAGSALLEVRAANGISRPLGQVAIAPDRPAFLPEEGYAVDDPQATLVLRLVRQTAPGTGGMIDGRQNLRAKTRLEPTAPLSIEIPLARIR